MPFDREKGWPVLCIDNTDLPLPPRPGIKPRRADLCPRCGCLHLTREEADTCRHIAYCREQK